MQDAANEIDQLIDKAKANNETFQGYENLKNELYYLIYEIKERL